MKKFIFNNQTKSILQTVKQCLSQKNHQKALKTTLLISSPSLTDQTFSLFLKSGHIFDTYLSTTLITHFAKLADFPRSRRYLFDTDKPDTVAFNALFSGYAKFHHPCFELFRVMVSDYGLMPDKYSLSSLIKLCDSFDEIRVSHLICVKLGFNLSGFVVSGLITKYGKLGFVEFAENCFNECLELDNVVCCNMINGYVWNYEFDKGKSVFCLIRKLGLELNEFSLSSVVGALWEVREGEIIHGFAVKLGFLSGGYLHLSNVIMNLYARCGCKGNARKVFDEMPNPDVVSWTARIGVSEDGCEGLEIFKLLHSKGCEFNELTIVNVLSSIEGDKLLVEARQVHSVCYKAGYVCVVSVSNALVSLYGKCRVINDANRVFDEMVFRDSISWNSLIGGYSDNGLFSSALNVLSQMRDLGIYPDQYTLASVLGAVEGVEFTIFVMQIHSYLIKTGLASDSSMLSCLISSYGKCHSLDYAKKVLSSVQVFNIGYFKVMAASAITAGNPTESLECLNSSMRICSEIDPDLLSIVLKACSAMTNLAQGKIIHSMALKSGFGIDRFVETAIIDFYCKCGCISDATDIFSDISTSNLAAWNAMIMGFAQHGRYKEVLSLSLKMTELGIKPDEITYLGILQSCCHSGLVKEAHIHLNSMYDIHGLNPCLEHYASMVDLLGRVGLVKEAKLFIDKMPLNPDAHVWQSLLSACNNFGNLEIGEVAARELLKLQPENDSAYILLASLYAKVRDWDTVRKLRREMKEKSIYKEAGSSWTEIGGSVSYFLAEDISHPESENIYSCLKFLSEQMLPSETDEDCFASVDCL